MKDNNPHKKLVLIISGFIILVLIFSLIYYLITKKPSNLDPTKQPEYTVAYVDPYSGETLIETPNKKPEFNMDEVVIYLGLTKLIDYGLTSDQIILFKEHFENFKEKSQADYNELSLNTSTIDAKYSKNTGISSLSFDIIINREITLKAKIEYTSINELSLVLTDPNTNNILYSSNS